MLGLAPASATESGAGHYITGTYAAPGAGIVPPQPGLYWSNVNLVYDASASNSLQLPVAGNIVTGLRGTFSSFALSAIYVPPVKLGPFTIAAGITLPGQYMDASASLGSRTRSDTSGGFGDMVITPFILGWNAGPHFLQTRLDIFAPTGPYKFGSLANIGMNYWTFTPTLAYTYLNPALGLDVSANLGIDFNTTNEKTNYHSGAMLHFDSAVTKSIGTSGLGLGVLFAVLSQIRRRQRATRATARRRTRAVVRGGTGRPLRLQARRHGGQLVLPLGAGVRHPKAVERQRHLPQLRRPVLNDAGAGRGAAGTRARGVFATADTDDAGPDRCLPSTDPQRAQHGSAERNDADDAAPPRLGRQLRALPRPDHRRLAQPSRRPTRTLG